MIRADSRPVAAIDCGTNSTRLLVLDGSGRRLARHMRITRLGEGIDRSGRLSEAGIARTLETLADFAERCGDLGVGELAAVATSAVRDASNAEDFLTPAGAVLGSPPSVIEGVAEGRLSYRGAVEGLPGDEGPYLVFDIGGGSTEFVLGPEPGLPGDVRAVVSVDVGCVRVTERYLHHDPPLSGELEEARSAVAALLEAGLGQEPLWRRGGTLVGLAGTVSALTVLLLGLEGFEESKVHHARLSRREISEVTNELSSLSVAERKQVRGMEEARADVIVGGALVLDEVMGYLGGHELLVSESDILDGLALSLLDDERSAG